SESADGYKFSNSTLRSHGHPKRRMPSLSYGAEFMEMGRKKRTAEEILATLKKDKEERQSEIISFPGVSLAAKRAECVMDSAAHHGFAGKVVETIGPHSEADPNAILLQLLTCAGNVIGRAAYYQVESDRHHANLFTVLVGASSKARKGTSMGRVTAVVRVADDRWCDERMKGGLSSGEGLINEVRDE